MQFVDIFSRGRGTMLTFGCRGAVVAMLVVLAGCADDGRAWTKAGVDNAQRAADFSDCRDETRQQTQRDYAIDSDIMASRGSGWRSGGSTQQEKIIGNDGEKGTQILNACMIGRGYSPAT